MPRKNLISRALSGGELKQTDSSLAQVNMALNMLPIKVLVLFQLMSKFICTNYWDQVNDIIEINPENEILESNPTLDNEKSELGNVIHIHISFVRKRSNVIKIVVGLAHKFILRNSCFIS